MTDYDSPWKNALAVVTQAYLKAQETAHSDEARYQAKRALSGVCTGAATGERIS